MSFLSGNTKSYSQPEQKPLGLEPRRLATNEQARPVPVIMGTNTVGVTFLSQAFNQITREVKEDFGKEDRVVGYQYFCSFAALIGQGPLDRINSIRFDNEQVWPAAGDPGVTRDTTVDKLVRIKVLTQGSGYTAASVLTVGGSGSARPVVRNGKIVEVIVTSQGSGYVAAPSVSANIGTGATFQAVLGSETYTTLSIPFQGQVCSWRVYWGMVDTDFDETLLSLSPDISRNPDDITGENVPENHPAYSGQAYFVAVSHYLGYNKTSVQQIEINVSRFPQASSMEDPSNVVDDCNPVHVLTELLQNTRYGLGLPDGRLALTNLNEIAALLEAEGNAISPVITRTTSFRELLTQVLEYVDGYHYTDAEGRFALGLIRQVDCEEEDATTPYFDETCLTEPPRLDPTSWDTTANFVYVSFTNRDNGHKEDAIGIPNRHNLKLTGEPTAEVLQRPWFTRPALVDLYARAMAQVVGIPRQTGRIMLRKSKLVGTLDGATDPIQIGGVFKLQYGHLGLCYMWARATQIRISDPYRSEVEVSFEVDRGFLNQRTYQAPIYSAPSPIVHQIEDIAQQRLIEMPYIDQNVKSPTMPRVLALVARPTAMTTGFAVHLIENTVAKQLKKINNFAYHGTVDSDFLKTDSGHLTVTLDGIDKALPSIVNIDGITNAWLLFVGDEIMAIRHSETVDLAEHRYELTVDRERFDTARLDHSAGADVFILSKTDATLCIVDGSTATVTPWTDGNTADFKVQPVVTGTGQDLADVTVESVAFTDRAKKFWKPRDLEVNGTKWYEGDAEYSTGGAIVVEWVTTSRIAPRFEDDLQDLWYIELLDGASVMLTKTAAARSDSVTITNAELQAAFSGEPASFTVKIYAQQIADGQPVDTSIHSDEITVNLV